MMKLTPQELDVFKNLSETEMGTFLVEYARRVQDFCYNSRNWGPGMTKEAAEMAANAIQENFIDKIRPSKKSTEVLNQHE